MKKVFLAMALSLMVTMGIKAQGYPVIDISNVIQSIQNGYTMVEQLNAMYSYIKSSYDQLQQQIKSFESFDFSKLNANDPIGSWRSIMTYGSRMMTYEKNIENIINKRDIKIGEGAYSLGDLFMSPGNTVVDMTIDGLSFVYDPFEKQLSPQEKAAFHQKYGMSYGNYMRINHFGEALKKKSAEVVGYSDGFQKNLTEDREKLGAITDELYESDSIVQQQQMNNAMMSIMAQDIKTQANILAEIAKLMAMSQAQSQIEKEAMMDELNINDMDVPDGLMKMLNDMPSSDKYK
jgi:conjugal transfer/entry exclusion protein